MISLLAALALAASRGPAPSGDLPFAVHERTLKNGLHIAFVPFDSKGLASFFTVFRVGSRNEVEAGRSGYAHFFEHLSFRGTKTVSGEEWDRQTKGLGLSTNAFTSDDITAYHLDGPSAALGEIVRLEADRFANLAYSEDDFKVEARAVLGELNKDKTDPDYLLEETLRQLAFQKHTYRHTTIGFEKDVRDMPAGFVYSMEFYRRFYQPDNAWVVVVGDFDEEAVARQIDDTYGRWKGKSVAAKVEAEPPQAKELEQRVGWATPTLPRVYVGWHVPPAPDVAATATGQVLGALLFDRLSPLYQELVLEKHLVENIEGGLDVHRDSFLFTWLAKLTSEAAEAPVRAAVDAAIARIARGEIDAAALEAVKSHERNSWLLSLETPHHIALRLATAIASGGEPAWAGRHLEALSKVSAADLAAYAKKYLVPSNRSTVVLRHAPPGSGTTSAPAKSAGGVR